MANFTLSDLCRAPLWREHLVDALEFPCLDLPNGAGLPRLQVRAGVSNAQGRHPEVSPSGRTNQVSRANASNSLGEA